MTEYSGGTIDPDYEPGAVLRLNHGCPGLSGSQIEEVRRAGPRGDGRGAATDVPTIVHVNVQHFHGPIPEGSRPCP